MTRGVYRDARLARLTALVARVEGTTRAVARLATVAALAGAVGGLVLWCSTSGRHLREPGQNAAVSVVVLALCLVPSGWLLNVRFSLLAVLRLPATLGEVTVRRSSGLLRRNPPGSSAVPARPTGTLASVRTLRVLVRDYGDVAGSWATVAQLVTPTFWAVTALALLAVPILVAVAAVAGLLAAFS